MAGMVIPAPVVMMASGTWGRCPLLGSVSAKS